MAVEVAAEAHYWEEGWVALAELAVVDLADKEAVVDTVETGVLKAGVQEAAVMELALEVGWVE